MVTDISALARTLHSSSASSEEKLCAAEGLSNALLSSDTSSESVQITALLRSHYVSSLLDWLLQCVGRSSGGGGVANKNGNKLTAITTRPASESTLKLWLLLETTLGHSLVSPERPLPASLLTHITAAIQAPTEHGPKTRPQLLFTLGEILKILGTKFNASFKPALEPTAALVETVIDQYLGQNSDFRPNLGAAALDLFVPLLKQQPNPRKSWDAVVPRLFALLVDAGFPTTPIEGDEEDKVDYEKFAAGCLESLACSLFNQAHVVSISDAAAMAIKPKKTQQEKSAQEAVAAMFNPPAKPSRLYTSQLFNQIEKIIETAGKKEEERNEEELLYGDGIFLALPWLIEQYVVALNRYKRAAEIAAEIASQAGLRLPSGNAAGDGATVEGASKGKETRSIGGVPVDADFKFFTALTLLLKNKLASLGETISQSDWGSTSITSGRAVQKNLLFALSTVCSTLKPCHIYRPTEDPEGKNREWLADLVSIAIQYSKEDDTPYDEPSKGDTSNTTASLKVLEAILSVEHRGVQPHLPLLWPMLWSTPPVPLHTHEVDEKVKAQEESDFLVQINVATSLIHAYGELRQLEVLLSSLVAAVCASTGSCPAAAKLVTAPAFLKSLTTAVRNVPSGQVAALVRMVTSWIPTLKPSEYSSENGKPLLIADLGSACIAALHVDVITAPAVADALNSLVRSLSPLLSTPIRLGTEGRPRGLNSQATTGTDECTAGALMLYRQALKLHKLCCLLHPEVVPLPGQELYISNKANKPSGGYFDAVVVESDDSMIVDFNDTAALSSSIPTEPANAGFWKLAGYPPQYLQIAIQRSAVDRVEILQYRKLHAKHACDPGSNERLREQNEDSGHLAVVENEIMFLGKLLLERCSDLILKNQAVLDALLESFDRLDNESQTKLMDLLLLQLNKEGNEGENGNSGNSMMESALSYPDVAAAIPLKLARTIQLAAGKITCLDQPSLEPATKPQKSKKKRTAEGEDDVLEKVQMVYSPLEMLETCADQALDGKFSQEKLKKALSVAVKRLTEISSQPLAKSSSPSSKLSKKRKSESFEKPSFGDAKYIDDKLRNLIFYLSQALLLDLQSSGKVGVEALVVFAIAAASAAAASMCGLNSNNNNLESSLLGMKVITKAMNFIASAAASGDGNAAGGDIRAEAPLQSLCSSEGLAFLECLLTTVSVAVDKAAQEGSNEDVENVRKSVKIALNKLLLHSFLESPDSASFLVKWLEDKLTSESPLSAPLALLLEGMMAACEEFLVSIMTSKRQGDQPSSGGAVSLAASEALAVSLVACFESQAPSLSSLLPENPTSLDDYYKINSLTACAAYIIRIRCLAPGAVVEKLEKLRGASPSTVLTRMTEDIAAVATVLTHSNIDFNSTPISGCLKYLEAACLATSAMKPAASAEHFASLVCFCVHILALLPINTECIDPVRRTIPLSAAFPAARILPSDAAMSTGHRSAMLGALCTLLDGSNSQQLRDVISFVERTLSTSSADNPYLLSITELGLMALEASRGKAALSTLAQRGERVASALTATLDHAACPLSLPYNATTGQIDGSVDKSLAANRIASFAALHAAFMNTPMSQPQNASNDENRSWTTREIIPSNSTSGTASTILACATALRALESIAARPKVFSLSSRHLARILNFINILGEERKGESLLDSFNPATASVYANVCHLLTACARHRESELGRCLPLFGHAVRALLTVLVRWEGKESASTGKSSSISVRVYCAEALAAVMAEIANLKASDKYCPHILADYLILAACPVTPTALTLLGTTTTSAASTGEEESTDHRAKLLCSPQIAAALRQGAYAIYGACGTAGIQYVYASFGSRGSGGLWRAGLTALKADHDKSFKYTGKV